jgi:hypothetical protein
MEHRLQPVLTPRLKPLLHPRSPDPRHGRCCSSRGGSQKEEAMKRFIASIIVASFAIAIPAVADSKAVKAAKHQCRVEYDDAKHQASLLKTHKERVDAKRDAKKTYEACVDNAKRKM